MDYLLPGIVLLKGFDAKGFQFYTNYNSFKGKQLLVTSSLLGYFSEGTGVMVRISR